jgi:hypothetical protein
MTTEGLTDIETQIIGECLRAAANGPFFMDEGVDNPSWEFHSLFGLAREELARIAAAWPDVEINDESVILAINNSLTNLLSYPHGHDKDWLGFISVPTDEVAAVFEKWQRLNGQK